MRLTWTLVLKAIDIGLGVAAKVDEWNDARKARKRQGLSMKDVLHQQDQIARATRAASKTVIIPRRK